MSENFSTALLVESHVCISEFLCPIAHRLPVDPVCAADGRIYERACITEALRIRPSISPISNGPMDATLHPAVFVSSILSKLVESGIRLPLLTEWKANRDQAEARATELASVLPSAKILFSDGGKHIRTEYAVGHMTRPIYI